MEWTREVIDRLYVEYLAHIDRLRADVIESNRTLGSPTPERIKLETLGRSEFQEILMRPSDDREVTCLWIRRIIRGHESRYPELTVYISNDQADLPALTHPVAQHRTAS